jgi:hypothetical protein
VNIEACDGYVHEEVADASSNWTPARALRSWKGLGGRVWP